MGEVARRRWGGRRCRPCCGRGVSECSTGASGARRRGAGWVLLVSPSAQVTARTVAYTDLSRPHEAEGRRDSQRLGGSASSRLRVECCLWWMTRRA